MQRSAISRERALAARAAGVAPLLATPLGRVENPIPPSLPPEAVRSAPQIVAQAAASASAVPDKYAAFFTAPSSPEHIVFDFGPISPAFIADLGVSGEPKEPLSGRTMLPAGFGWKDTHGSQCIPMVLAEFLAYKSALAYEDGPVIEASLGPATGFKFFDTRGRIADTQGFGFLQDGMAFIVMRGSEKVAGDWDVNLNAGLTDLLGDEDGKVVERLVKRHKVGADHIGEVGKLMTHLRSFPGTHVGFALAWSAVLDQVNDFLKSVDSRVPVVLSGHSLGGALATLGAFDLQRNGREVAAVVTFGAPQVGNEVFAKAYAMPGNGGFSLTDKTVRFVADGDSVPRIMRRWYYRLSKELQELIVTLSRPAAAPKTDLQFADIGGRLMFGAQPALSPDEVKRTIRAIIEAREKQKREAEEREKKDKKQKEAEKPVGSGGNGASASGAMQGTNANGGAAPQSGSRTSAEPGGQTGADDQSKYVVYIFATIAAFIVLVFLWLFVRSKLASHAITERYALFLSTLSYQKIRSLRNDPAVPPEERLKLASTDLDRYLRFVRGDTNPNASYFGKSSISNLPVRLTADLDLATFTSEAKNII